MERYSTCSCGADANVKLWFSTQWQCKLFPRISAGLITTKRRGKAVNGGVHKEGCFPRDLVKAEGWFSGSLCSIRFLAGHFYILAIINWDGIIWGISQNKVVTQSDPFKDSDRSSRICGEHACCGREAFIFLLIVVCEVLCSPTYRRRLGYMIVGIFFSLQIASDI